MRTSKTASLMKIMRSIIDSENTNVADLEIKIKFISNSSPSIVFIEKIQNIVANKSLKDPEKQI
jgi:hypothetical protein